MQSVSQEWIDNQSAIVRKPGFIVVNIPDVKISCGSISHRVETVGGETQYISDPLGCDYLGKCGVEITVNTSLLGSNSITLVSFNNKSVQLNSKTITSSNLTNGKYYWETTGFSKINVICKKDCITDMQLYAYGIPRSDIQSYTHTRSYDPMGFELPNNEVNIDIYNYNDKYTEFYKSYSNEGYSIVVYYGYALDSGDEIILGGTFHLTDVQLSDNVLTITGESLLAFIDEKGSMNIFDLKANESGYIRIQVSDSAQSRGTYRIDVASRPEFNITGDDIINCLMAKTSISISTNSDYSSVLSSNRWFNVGYIDIIQALINLLLVRCFVDREDCLHYDICDDSSILSDNILLSNCLDVPEYSSTKKVKKFEITSQTSSGKEQTVEWYSDAGDYVSSDTTTKRYAIDTINNIVTRIVAYCRGISYIDISPSQVSVNIYCNSSSYNEYIDWYWDAVTDTIHNITIDTSGVICDIDSPLGVPSDTNKIVNYFSNRDLYTFNVRGNPARDVGDYVGVSLTNDDDTATYKKGLVLSSTLSYDGSFKEEVTVRIIENDFE